MAKTIKKTPAKKSVAKKCTTKKSVGTKTISKKIVPESKKTHKKRVGRIIASVLAVSALAGGLTFCLTNDKVKSYLGIGSEIIETETKKDLEIKDLKSKINVLEDSVKILNQDKEKLILERDIALKNHETAVAERDAFKNQLDLEKELTAEQSAKLSELETRVESTQNALTLAENTLIEKEDLILNLENQIEDLNEQIKNLETEKSELQVQLEELQKKLDEMGEATVDENVKLLDNSFNLRFQLRKFNNSSFKVEPINKYLTISNNPLFPGLYILDLDNYTIEKFEQEDSVNESADLKNIDFSQYTGMSYSNRNGGIYIYNNNSVLFFDCLNNQLLDLEKMFFSHNSSEVEINNFNFVFNFENIDTSCNGLYFTYNDGATKGLYKILYNGGTVELKQVHEKYFNYDVWEEYKNGWYKLTSSTDNEQPAIYINPESENVTENIWF